jgi:hypothetical protein
MSDLEQDLQELSAQYDAELEAVAPTTSSSSSSSTDANEAARVGDCNDGTELQRLQLQYDKLLKTKQEFERIIKHQMCMIRFMGETAQSLGIDFRDFPQDQYFTTQR